MSISTFPQPLYAKDLEDNQIIVLAVCTYPKEGAYYLVMYNDPSHVWHGRSAFLKKEEVVFEHFYWPEIEPSDSIADFVHPQEPALKVW